MPLNPFALIAKAFYRPFKAAIIATYNAAKADALAEIQADLPTDTDFQEVAIALDEARDEQPLMLAIADKKRGKK